MFCAACCSVYLLFLRSAVKTFIAMYIHGRYNMCLTQMRGIFSVYVVNYRFVMPSCVVFSRKKRRGNINLYPQHLPTIISFFTVLSFFPLFSLTPRLQKTYTFSANLLFFHFQNRTTCNLHANYVTLIHCAIKIQFRQTLFVFPFPSAVVRICIYLSHGSEEISHQITILRTQLRLKKN